MPECNRDARPLGPEREGICRMGGVIADFFRLSFHHGDTESLRREREQAEARSEVHGFGPGRVVCEKEQDIGITVVPRRKPHVEVSGRVSLAVAGRLRDCPRL